MNHFARFFAGISLFATAALTLAQYPGPTQFYVVAHEDDWQLFMGSQAWTDIVDNKPVVVIYLTAGDAGYGSASGGAAGQAAFYKAREKAAIASNNVPTSQNPIGFGNYDWNYRTFVNGHLINHTVHANTDNWFIRFPDGGVDGSGSAVNSYASLRSLRQGLVSNVRSVDKSAIYANWNDMNTTIGAIMALYTPGTANLTELDPILNPGGNSDHMETSWLVMNGGKNSVTGYRFWNDYSISGLPAGSVKLVQDKSMLLGAMTASLAQSGWNYYADEAHRSFCLNEIFRTVPATFSYSAFPRP